MFPKHLTLKMFKIELLGPVSLLHANIHHDTLLFLILVNSATTLPVKILGLCFSGVPQLILLSMQSISLSYWASPYRVPSYQLLTTSYFTLLPGPSSMISYQFSSLPSLPSAFLKSNQNDLLKIECRHVSPLLKTYDQFSVYLNLQILNMACKTQNVPIPVASNWCLSPFQA